MDIKYKYRFKTLPELKKEFGNSGCRLLSGFDVFGEMDHLFNQLIEIPVGCIDDEGNIYRFEMYDEKLNRSITVYDKMITKYIERPNYSPKTFIRE